MRLDDIPALDLPVPEMSVPVMIALLARIQDELQKDEVTGIAAANLAVIIAALLELREEGELPPEEVELRRRISIGLKAEKPLRLC